MNDEERQLWQNFSDAIRRLLEHPDLTEDQRNSLFQNLKEEHNSNVIEFPVKPERK